MASHLRSRSIIPLFLTVFLDLVGLGIAIPPLAVAFLSPTLSVFPPDTPFEIRSIAFGFLVASFPLAQFFGAPLLGALSDRYGRKPLLILSLIGTAIGYVFFALGIYLRNIPLLFLSRMIDGFSGGNLSIAVSAIADISTEKERARNFGLIGMAFGMGFVLGPYFGGVLSDPSVVSWFDLATPFWFAAILTVINIFLFLWLFTETLHTRIHTKISLLTGFHNLKKAWDMSHMRTILLVVFLLTLGFNFFTQFFQVFLIEKFSFTTSQIGKLFAFAGIWIAVSQGAINRPLARRFAPSPLLSVSSILLAFCFPLLLISDTALGIYLTMPLIAIFQGLTDPNATAVVSNMTDDASQGEIMGIKQSIQSVAQALPPIIAGFMSSVNINLPILLASILTLLAWAVFVFIFKERPKQVFHEVS